MVGRASPEKEGWERMVGDVVKAARGRAGFIVLCRLKHTGTAPNPIGGARPETASHRYRFHHKYYTEVENLIVNQVILLLVGC
jgi:hypothetical protein